jgi:hypothetical protein
VSTGAGLSRAAAAGGGGCGASPSFSSDGARHADGSARQNRRNQGGDVALTGFLGVEIFFALFTYSLPLLKFLSHLVLLADTGDVLCTVSVYV